MQINNYSAKDIKWYLHKCSLPCRVLFGFLPNLPFLSVFIELMSAIESCRQYNFFLEIISTINKKNIVVLILLLQPIIMARFPCRVTRPYQASCHTNLKNNL